MSKIWIPGSGGFVGKNIKNYFKNDQCFYVEGKNNSDLTVADNAKNLIKTVQPDYVINLVGKVGGIVENMKYPATFFYQNMMSSMNIIHHSQQEASLKNFIQLGSACSYPKSDVVPFSEDFIFSGPPEPTNEAYAIAKRSTLSMLQAYNKQHGFKYLYLIAGNLYGPNDNLDPQQSHVIPSIFRKFLTAERRSEKFITMLGTGNPTRDFLFIDDLCEYIEKLIDYSSYDPINMSSGEDISIKELTYLIRDILNLKDIEVRWDTTKPDGQMKRKLDLTKINSIVKLQTTPLTIGLEKTKDYMLKNMEIK